MFEWFVIYLLVQAEELRNFFGSHDTLLVVVGVVMLAAVYIIAAIRSESTYTTDGIPMADTLGLPAAKRLLATGKVCIAVGIIFALFSSIIPTQKNMAIIVGSGVVYSAVTSDTGKRIANKGVLLLEKKIEELLSDEVQPAEQPKEKGQAL